MGGCAEDRTMTGQPLGTGAAVLASAGMACVMWTEDAGRGGRPARCAVGRRSGRDVEVPASDDYERPGARAPETPARARTRHSCRRSSRGQADRRSPGTSAGREHRVRDRCEGTQVSMSASASRLPLRNAGGVPCGCVHVTLLHEPPARRRRRHHRGAAPRGPQGRVRRGAAVPFNGARVRPAGRLDGSSSGRLVGGRRPTATGGGITTTPRAADNPHSTSDPPSRINSTPSSLSRRSTHTPTASPPPSTSLPTTRPPRRLHRSRTSPHLIANPGPLQPCSDCRRPAPPAPRLG
jgi:hypothetical protein